MRKFIAGLLGDGPSFSPDELMNQAIAPRYFDAAGREIANPYAYDVDGTPYLIDPNSPLFQFTAGPVNTEDIFSTGIDPWLYREVLQMHNANPVPGAVLMLQPSDLVSTMSEPRILTSPSVMFNSPALPPSLQPGTKTIQPDPEQVARNQSSLTYAPYSPSQRTPSQPGQPGGAVQSEESGAPANASTAAPAGTSGGALLLAALAAFSLFN